MPVSTMNNSTCAGNMRPSPEKNGGSQLQRSLMQVLRETHPELASSDVLHFMVERILLAIEECRNELSESAQWIYLRVSHADPVRYRRAIQFDIAPEIFELCRTFPLGGWWWLSKRDAVGTAIRLRIAVPAACSSQVGRRLSTALSSKGYDVKALRYEPEMRLFGGRKGLAIAHELFFRDSEFLTRWAQCEDKLRYPFIPVGLSMAIMVYLTGVAGLDSFERWDVFSQLSDKRPMESLDGGDAKQQEYEQLARRIVSAGPVAVFDLYRGPQAELLSAYQAHLCESGRSLSLAYFGGELKCGMREFLVPVLIFHLNRTGMSWQAQVRMARAMKDAFQQLVHSSVKNEASE